MNNNSYSGIINSGRSPSNVLIWRQGQWVFMRKGRETIISTQGISMDAENRAGDINSK